ncbi:hypothetical protein LSAT2_015391 [Lamellibrachia satsuma]|nr:hypothetical protein LSAT2_015391 [Lamellibrachia satsuma]
MQQLQTGHIESFISGTLLSHHTSEVKSNEFITFNGRYVLQKLVYSRVIGTENIYNITGVVCKRGAYVNTHPLDQFESFSATVVMVYPSHSFSTITKEFYDNGMILASSLIFALPGTSVERRFGHRYLCIIRDGNADYGINTTAELYYTTDRWVTGGAHPNDDAAPETNEYNEVVGGSKLFGFWYDTTSAHMSSYLPGLIPKVTHVHESKEGIGDFSVFDISACYEQPKQLERVAFSLPGCYSGIMRTRLKLLETALRQYIARKTGVDLIRGGEIERVSRITLAEAVTRLKDAVDAVPARPLVVEYPEGDQVSISIIVISCNNSSSSSSTNSTKSSSSSCSSRSSSSSSSNGNISNSNNTVTVNVIIAAV